MYHQHALALYTRIKIRLRRLGMRGNGTQRKPHNLLAQQQTSDEHGWHPQEAPVLGLEPLQCERSAADDQLGRSRLRSESPAGVRGPDSLERHHCGLVGSHVARRGDAIELLPDGCSEGLLTFKQRTASHIDARSLHSPCTKGVGSQSTSLARARSRTNAV